MTSAFASDSSRSFRFVAIVDVKLEASEDELTTVEAIELTASRLLLVTDEPRMMLASGVEQWMLDDVGTVLEAAKSCEAAS